MAVRVLLPLVVAGPLLLAGCASGDDTGTDAARTTPATTTAHTTSGPATSTPGSPAEEDGVVEVAIEVRDGKVSPKASRVKVPLGDTVRLVVTSDIDDELHVHGYDAEGDLEAGRPSAVEFVADQPGLFEVETHDTELLLVQLEVR